MSEPKCCGALHGATAGGALQPQCQLCPDSPSHWQRNRADGRPYEPATLDEAYQSIADKEA